MPDKKLTDNEIIKALECCINNGDCRECALNPKKGNYGYCTGLAIKSALDLINRQKAEVERLKQNLEEAHIDIKEHIKKGAAERKYDRALIKAEAYKEFAEKLKDEYTERFLVSGDILIETIDDLLKELVGDAAPKSN